MSFTTFTCEMLIVFLTAQVSDTPSQSGELAKPPEVRDNIEVPPPPTDPVPLLDGAPTAEAALKAMVAASNAGDDEAAFLMVDPEIRPLLVPEMAIERCAIDSSILEYGSFGKPEFQVGGMLFWFTLRDLVRIRSMEVLNTRTVDDRRVVFTIRTTEKSYHEDKHIHNERQVLAIRRADKWYVFRPYGLLVSLLRGDHFISPDGERQSAVIQLRRPSDEDETSQTDFQIDFLVPIEVIHEHLAEAAKAPEFRKLGLAAEKTRRQFQSVVTRTKRGDFRTRGELKAALDEVEKAFHELAEVNTILSPGIRDLAKQYLPEKTAEETIP